MRARVLFPIVYCGVSSSFFFFFLFVLFSNSSYTYWSMDYRLCFILDFILCSFSASIALHASGVFLCVAILLSYHT